MIFGKVLSALKGNPRNSAAELPINWAQHVQNVTDHKFLLPPPAHSREWADWYNTHPRVRAIVSKIAKALAQVPWYLEGPKDKSGKAKRIDEHEALAFLRAGNPKMPNDIAWEAMSTYLELNGECFVVVGRIGGKPRFWAPVPAYWVFDVPDDLVNGKFKINPLNQAPLEIDAKDVIYLREIDPAKPYNRGTSHSGAAATEIATDKAAATFLNTFFSNNAQPSLVISGTETRPMADKDRARLQAYWEERHRGASKAGRNFFSTSKLEVQEIGSGLRDNEMSKLREQLGQFAFEHWGLPPEIMGRLDNSNRATIDTADELFARHVLVPRLNLLRSWLEPFVALEFGLTGAGLKLKYESPVKEDTAFRLEVVKAAPNDFSRNEVRALAGLPPVDGGDELKDRPDPNMLPHDPNAGPPDGGDTPGKENDKKPQKGVDSDISGTLNASPMKHETNIVAEKPAQVWRSISPDDLIRVSEAHQSPLVTMEATAIFRRVYENLLKEYGAELLTELASEADFQVSTAVAAWLDERSSWLIGAIDETTRSALQASLLAGVAANEDVAKLAERVDAIFAAAADTRAALISQTEATALTGFGSQTAAEQGGFQFKEWLSTRDQAVRDTHKALDGQRVSVYSDFVSKSGAHGPHPGEMSAKAENMNCRCAMRPVLDGEKALDAEAFLKFHGHQMDSISTTVLMTTRKVFRAQHQLVMDELKRVAGKV